MTCKLCGQRPAKARGLCSACYQIERLAGRLGQHGLRQRPPCAVDGCDLLASSKGYCKKHAERHRRGTLERRQVVDLPGELWAEIAGHPNWQVSTSGRIKSSRGGHERLVKTRMVAGRLLAGDHGYGNITVHLAVLRAFRPDGEADGGKAVFIDGAINNPALANLEWETTTDRMRRAIAMAEASTSPWAAEFDAFWQGDKRALDRFFSEMRALLLASYRRKAESYRHAYPLEAGEYAAATLFVVYQAIARASLQHLDNLPAWVLKAGDNIFLQHHRYTEDLSGMDSGLEDSTTTVADMIGWTMPSAETEAIYNETRPSA